MGVDRSWHEKRIPHRTLRRGHRGEDVVDFQHFLNVRLRHIPGDGDALILVVDGVFGERTLRAWRAVRKWIGLPLWLPPTRAAQDNVRDPRTRSKRAVARGRARRRAARRPMRIRAWENAGALLHVREVGGNNRGPMVERIITSSGGRVGDAWCGWLVSYCYRLAGSVLTNWMWGAVRLMANAGLLRTSNPLTGHIVRFTFDHTALFGHWCDSTGRAVPRSRATHVFTREGNTTNWSTTSDAGGDEGVHERIRAIYLVRDFLAVPR